MNTDTYTLRNTFRSAYRGAATTYGKECIRLTVAVLAKDITREEFRAKLDALDVQFGKRAPHFTEREPGEDDA